MSDPITRKEQYYAKMAGEDISIPEPITREEQYLDEIAEGGGGGGGGGSSSALVVHEVDGTLDKTWQEIYDAMANGTIVIVIYEGVDNVAHNIAVSILHVEGSDYMVTCVCADNNGVYTSPYVAESANGYPVYDG